MKLWLKLPFSFSSFSHSVCLSVSFSPFALALPVGISSTAYRWASAADSRRWPRWAKAALPREESGCGVALQTETQTVGQLPREESWGAQHHECLTVGEWAWNRWAGMKCGLRVASVSVFVVTRTPDKLPTSSGSLRGVFCMGKIRFRDVLHFNKWVRLQDV